MRMNKILTAVCVLTAVSTVAVGISGVKIALADSSGYIMDSQKNQDDISFGKFGNNFDMAKDLSDEEQKKLFDEYKKVEFIIRTGCCITKINQSAVLLIPAECWKE